MKTHLLAFILLSIVLQSCITRKGAFTGTAWGKQSDQSQFTKDQFSALSQYIADSLNTSGLVVIKDGKMIYEYGDIEQVSYIASCRKSVLAMLYGKFVEDGTIDLDQEIGPLGINEKDGLLPIEKKATIDHIITSRSGVFHVASNGGYDKANFKERGSKQPGSYFVYNNWDFNVGGYILELYANRTIYEELEDQLAKPLGFQDWHLKNQRKYGRRKNSQYKAYHIYVSTRDMAKMGQLMLNKGKWNGEQLIAKSWINKITSTVTSEDTVMARRGWDHPSVPRYSYGYMWWLMKEFKGKDLYDGAFSATGYGGQYITVIPQLNMVIAHKTKLNLWTKIGLSYKATNDGEYWGIVDRIVEAVD